jgi:hypothetical protein
MENRKCIYHKQKIMRMSIHSEPQKNRNDNSINITLGSSYFQSNKNTLEMMFIIRNISWKLNIINMLHQ